VVLVLVAHLLGELPALGVLGKRDQLLAAAWLASLRSARTRRSYAGDLLGWQAWLAKRGLEVLAAGRVHLDMWVRAQQDEGAGDASGRRRLSGVGSFYRYCLTHGLVAADPTAGVARPRVDPDYTATVGLTREQGRALIAAADGDGGRSSLRSAAVIRLLLHNALRVDEVLGADIADLGSDRGHQVLTVLGKGNRRAKVALTPGHAGGAASLPRAAGQLRRDGGMAWDGWAAAGYHQRGLDASQPTVGTCPPPRRGRGDRRVGPALPSNLLVVLCGDRATRHIVNAGSLYH